MLKLTKTLMVVLLAVTLVVSLTTASLAVGTIDSAVLDSINKTLDYINPNKELYGLGEVDFTELSVGNSIPAYEYANDVAAPLDFCLYPLIYKGDLVALAMKPYDSDSVNITTALVDEVKEYVSSADAFALVYDNSGCYISYSDGLAKLCESGDIVEDRGSIDESTTELDSMQMGCYQAVQRAGYKNRVSTSRAQTYVSLPVSYVPQASYSELCWAASVASVGKYLTGKSYTAAQIAQAYFNSKTDFNHSGGWDPSEAACLSGIYGIKNYIYGLYLSTQSVYTELNDGYPVLGGWVNGDYHHENVIYTADIQYNILGIMDPAFGFTSAGFNAESHSYVSPVTGIRLYYVFSCYAK